MLRALGVSSLFLPLRLNFNAKKHQGRNAKKRKVGTFVENVDTQAGANAKYWSIRFPEKLSSKQRDEEVKAFIKNNEHLQVICNSSKQFIVK